MNTEKKIRPGLGQRKSNFISLLPPCLLLHSHRYDIAFVAIQSFAKCHDLSEAEDTVIVTLAMWH